MVKDKIIRVICQRGRDHFLTNEQSCHPCFWLIPETQGNLHPSKKIKGILKLKILILGSENCLINFIWVRVYWFSFFLIWSKIKLSMLWKCDIKCIYNRATAIHNALPGCFDSNCISMWRKPATSHRGVQRTRHFIFRQQHLWQHDLRRQMLQ